MIPGAGPAARARRWARARARRAVRAALLRSSRAAPRPGELAGAERRVVFLLSSAWSMGGTIRSTLNVATQLAGRYEVEVVSVSRTRDRPFFGDPPPGVRLVALQDRRRPVLEGRLPPGQRLLRALPSVLMHPDDLTAPSWSLWTDVQLVRHLRGRAGILVGTRPGLNLILADLRLPGFVTVGQEHMHFARHPEPLRRAVRRRYRHLDVVTVLTERDRATYERLLQGAVPVVRLPNAVRDMGPGRADLGAPVVLSAGRLAPQKGFDMLIDAWAHVAPRHPEWQLRIFGDGPRRGPLRRRVRRRGVKGSVTLARAARDLGAEMDRASVFAMSSRYEGLPLILLEAMSKGMAVASFDCPTGPADLVQDGVNGLLVPRGDVEALAAALDRLMGDEGLRRRLGAAAPETASRYTMTSVGALWDALLADLAPRLRA